MAKEKIVLCDTNILIEFSKGNQPIIDELKEIGESAIAISSVTAGEFIYGALNKSELAKISKALATIQIIHVSEAISRHAIELLKKYSLSHNLTVPDSFIAATALEHGLEFYTLNLKDFRFIENLVLHSY